MGTVAQYNVSATSPSIVGGTGNTIKYFLNRSSIPSLVSRELILPFTTPTGSRLEAYITGRASSVGQIRYTVQANTNVNNVGLPPHLIQLGETSSFNGDSFFHFRLVLVVDDVVQGTFQSLVDGAFSKEWAIPLFQSSRDVFRFSLLAGVTFETSAETNRALLTEFKIVQV